MALDLSISGKAASSALAAGVGFAASWLLIRVILGRIKQARAQSERRFHHTHTEVVSRYGGLALAGAFVLILALIAVLPGLSAENSPEHMLIALGALAIFGLGFWDDVKPLGAKRKLAGQILIASFMYVAGLQVANFKVPGLEETYSLGYWLGAALTVAWLVGIPNLINLIDGTDGLAGGVSLMLMCLLSYVAWQGGGFGWLVAVGMSGALAGFLRFNFPPARIYMGDGGAYLLGFLIAALSLESSQKGTVAAALIAPLLALALPIIDMAFAVARRALVGLPVFRADQKHIHHRLRNSGLSRTKTVLALYGASLFFLILAFAAFWSQGKLLPTLLGILFLFAVVGARSLGLITDWAALGRTLGQSLEVRREVQYGLTLLRWLELEAARGPSMQDLWASFTFVAGKLRFSGVRARLPGAENSWRSPEPALGALRRSSHELHLGSVMTLEFEADSDALDATVFELLSELSAESWLKALHTWRRSQPEGAAFSFPFGQPEAAGGAAADPAPHILVAPGRTGALPMTAAAPRP